MTPQTLRRCCFNCKWWDELDSESSTLSYCEKQENNTWHFFNCPHFEWLPMPEEVRKDES